MVMHYDSAGNLDWSAAGLNLPVVNAYQYNKRRLLNGQGEYLSQPGWYLWGTGYGYNGNGQLATYTTARTASPPSATPQARAWPA